MLFVEPGTGLLACGDVGKGRMAEPEDIVAFVLQQLAVVPDYADKRVLVTAGATRESIDGVRYLSNHSSGKMGIALAECARSRGAQVTLVAAHVDVPLPEGVEVVRVNTTQEMYDAVLSRVGEQDVIIKAAAPADYTPSQPFTDKFKGDELCLRLVKTPDIAKAVGQCKGKCKLVVFAAETRDLIANAQAKLRDKNADLMVANDVTQAGAGFGVDTNIVTLLTATEVEPLPLMSKEEVAMRILDKVLTL